MRRAPVLLLIALTALSACTSTSTPNRPPGSSVTHHHTDFAPAPTTPTAPPASLSVGVVPAGLTGMPALLDPRDVYAADRPGALSLAVAHDPAYVYVPDTLSNDVYVIDQHTMMVVSRFPAGHEPQHVVPSYDLKTLYVTADKPGVGSLIPIDPKTRKPGRAIPVDDAYNMYFTPNGTYAIVVQEAYTRLAFYDPHSWRLHDSNLRQLRGRHGGGKMWVRGVR